MPPLDLSQLSELNFEEPDTDRFPCLALAYEALRRGGNGSGGLNAANEIAVAAFLADRIGFGDIFRINKSVLDAHSRENADSLEAVVRADREARAAAERLLAAPVAAGMIQSG
jgi:1-deoxy-D-xylulose-5-phosphate reductoisomerase